MKTTCSIRLVAATLGVVTYALGAPAGASLVNSNPSFEADPVGALGGAPTGWEFVPQVGTTQSAAYEIVTNQGVTDGAQALKVSLTIDSATNGFGRPVQAFNPGADPFNFSLPIDGLTPGQTYTALGSLTPLSPNTFYELQIQDSGPFFSTFTQFPVGSLSTTADPGLIGQTQSFSVNFVYGGGPLQYNVNIIDQSGSFSVTTVDLIVDNLRVVVPEPSGALFGVFASSVWIAARRRNR